MSEHPLISVVMPVYNGASFLEAAIASISGQTYRDFEFLIVDDGSTDTTPSLLAEAASQDSRIKILSHPVNQGVVASRNDLLQVAQGRFIAVMDSDDVALPNRLALQAAFLEAHPEVSALGGAVQIVDQADVPGAVKTYPLQPGLVAWSMLFFNSIAHSTLMLRKECLTGGYPAGGAEDYGLLMELSLRAQLANLPDVLVRYRTWPGALTARTWERQEQHANEIVQQAIAAVSGRSVSFDQIRMLRGLSRDQYPAQARDIRAIADLIRTLVPVWTDRMKGLGVDAAPIRRDAGVRLLLLASLALRRSPALAGSLAAAAVRLSPSSLSPFTRKVVGRLMRQSPAPKRLHDP